MIEMKMSWNEYIKKNKISRTIGLLFRARKVIKKSTLPTYITVSFTRTSSIA